MKNQPCPLHSLNTDPIDPRYSEVYCDRTVPVSLGRDGKPNVSAVPLEANSYYTATGGFKGWSLAYCKVSLLCVFIRVWCHNAMCVHFVCCLRAPMENSLNLTKSYRRQKPTSIRPSGPTSLVKTMPSGDEIVENYNCSKTSNEING